MIHSLLLLLYVSIKSVGAAPSTEYNCVLCMNTIDLMREKSISYFDACKKYMFCSFNQVKLMSLTSTDIHNAESRSICQCVEACPIDQIYSSSPAPFDMRISKGYGSRGYDKIRISQISNTTVRAPGIFTYSSPFKFRWTSNVLNTGVVTTTPGSPTEFIIDGKTISVTIPEENSGVRGVIIADPCFQSQWVKCEYKDTFQTFQRFTTILNAIHDGHTDTHYWSILGDNFYDQSGDPTSSWFNALSLSTKTRLLVSFPGNHDFWITGDPVTWTNKDQQSNGFMQWYAQDVQAGLASDVPYDFSVNPDVNPSAENIPPAKNFFSYYKIGNVAFFGFSSAHSYEETLPFFDEACNWAQLEKPAVILLVGHWNKEGLGCETNMTTPNIYKELSALPSCASLANKFKYVMGHTHANVVVEKDVGFMVAGQGMKSYSGDYGNGDFGFPIFDSTDSRFRIYYFSLAKSGVFDMESYNAILDCIVRSGVSACYSLATLWVDTAFS